MPKDELLFYLFTQIVVKVIVVTLGVFLHSPAVLLDAASDGGFEPEPQPIAYAVAEEILPVHIACVWSVGRYR